MLVLSCACAHLSPSVPEMEGICKYILYKPLEGILFLGCISGGVYVPVFTRMPGDRLCCVCVTSFNNNILYSSQREIQAVVRSHNEKHISIILSH